jgi:AsmA protein
MESKFDLAGFRMGGVDITDSKLNWLDQQSGKQFKVTKMNVSTQAFQQGQPLPLEIKAYVESNQPKWQGAVKAIAKIDFHENAVAFDANDLKLAVKAVFPDHQMERVSFLLVADSTINVAEQTAKLTNARLSTFGLKMSGSFDVQNIFSIPVIQGPLKVNTFEAGALAKQFDVELPRMAKATSLKAISLKTKFKTDFNTIYFDDISAQVDQSNIKGSLSVVVAAEPEVRFALEADSVHLPDYQIISDGARPDDAPFLLDLIREAQLEGVLDVASVSLAHTALEQLHITSTIDKGVVSANPIRMQVHGGEVKAALRLDARKTPAARLVAKVGQVDADAVINPLLATITGDETLTLSGLVDADVDVKATGTSMSAMKRTAKGTIKLKMDTATLEGVDFDNASRSVVVDYARRNDFRVSRKFASEYVPGSKTEFNSLAATLKLSKGKLVNSDLSLVSDLVSVSGTGTIDLINEKMDYRPIIDMNVRKTVNVRDKLRDHPMEYLVQGAFGEIATNFDVDKYDLWVGRLMLHEAKARKNRRINSQGDAWTNVLSK